MRDRQLFIIPTWISFWLVVSMLFVSWDLLFILSRPASFADGKFAALWLPYAKYITIDTSYADLSDDFVKTLPIMDLLEIGLGLLALLFNTICRGPFAILLAFTSILLTGTKTMFVFAHEIVGGYKHVGHNAIGDTILFYILPNSIWIVLPFFCVLSLGRLLCVHK